jgi:hypothetical protein
MNRLFEIATELGEIAHSRFVIRRGIDALDAKITAREAAMIPEGGWPGANADTRKAAEKAAKATDPELIKLADNRNAFQSSLDELECKREALVAERDAWQWTIRDRETQVHEGGIKESVFAQMDEYRAQR